MTRELAAQRRNHQQQLRALAADYQTILNGVAGALAIPKRRVEEARTEDLAPSIDKAAQLAARGLKLSSLTLSFARSCTDDVEPVDVHRLLTSAMPRWRGLLPDSVALEVAMPSQIPPI